MNGTVMPEIVTPTSIELVLPMHVAGFDSGVVEHQCLHNPSGNIPQMPLVSLIRKTYLTALALPVLRFSSAVPTPSNPPGITW